MTPDYSKCRTNKTLQGLSPLFQAWIEVLNRSLKSDDYEDVPWWYNERAILSTLAGAAWTLKTWTALEEFSTTKRGRVPGKKVEAGKLVRGRCDLYVSHGSTDFAIEAKQAWQPMRVAKPWNHIEKALKAAKKDAGNLTADQGDHRIALTFVVPFIPISKVSNCKEHGKPVIDRKMAKSVVQNWLKAIRLGQYEAYAYHFPTRCDLFHTKTRFFPGVLVIAERMKTGTKKSPTYAG